MADPSADTWGTFFTALWYTSLRGRGRAASAVRRRRGLARGEGRRGAPLPGAPALHLLAAAAAEECGREEVLGHVRGVCGAAWRGCGRGECA